MDCCFYLSGTSIKSMVEVYRNRLAHLYLAGETQFEIAVAFHVVTISLRRVNDSVYHCNSFHPRMQVATGSLTMKEVGMPTALLGVWSAWPWPISRSLLGISPISTLVGLPYPRNRFSA